MTTYTDDMPSPSDLAGDYIHPLSLSASTDDPPFM